MLGTRPDIAFAVTKLSQHAANPSKEHCNRALYICHYLIGTSNYALVYDGPSDGGLMAYSGLKNRCNVWRFRTGGGVAPGRVRIMLSAGGVK